MAILDIYGSFIVLKLQFLFGMARKFSQNMVIKYQLTFKILTFFWYEHTLKSNSTVKRATLPAFFLL